MNRLFRTSVTMAVCLAAASPVRAQDDDLTKLTLEDLLKVEVTSVSRKEQPLARVAAAVHVITEEDIRRSGARTIPEMLRMVPGFNVAEMDENTWAIGSRGFSAFFASKLLVLIDGRSVYTPLFAGVHWEMQNVLPSDIERIEVIRGPGGTLWGANAVNGVVNIITKPASATRGGLVTTVVEEPRGAEGEARYGAALGERVDFRVYGRALRRGSERFAGIESPDAADVEVGGGRVDWSRSDIEAVSVHAFVQQGELSRLRQTTSGGYTTDRAFFDEANIVASWTRTPSARSETSVQAYYDTSSYGVGNELETVDVDARHRHTFGTRHEVVFGGGYRVWDNFTAGFRPERERMAIVSGFVQDEIQLAKGLFVTPGSKFEHNGYTGFEIQPSLRGLWQPTTRHVVWAAAGRAVRTPSRANTSADLTFAAPMPNGTAIPIRLLGNPEMASETMVGLEAGYRVQFRTASVDVTTFRNAYRNLQSAEPQPIVSFTAPVPFAMGNGLEAETSGVEVAAKWIPWTRVRLAGSYSYLSLEAFNSPGSLDFLSRSVENSSAPRHQAQARVYVDLPKALEASALFWRVGAIPGNGTEAYSRLDLRLGWRGHQRVDIGGGVKNLLHGNSPEFIDISGNRSLARSATAFADVAWRF